MKPLKVALASLWLYGTVALAQQPVPIWHNDSFAVYRDKVTHGKYTAKALSDHELGSDYQSPTNIFKSSQITFKFSINGKDNEMPSGTDHQFNAIARPRDLKRMGKRCVYSSILLTASGRGPLYHVHP